MSTQVESASFYTRQATGLVREIDFTSNIALNVSFISLPLAALVATQAPFAFPGANIMLVVLICAVLCVFPTLLYGSLGATMPRSGGDYVFVSRIIHPIIGFAANFNVTMWFLLVIAQFGSLLAPFGLSAALATIGAATDNQGLIDASVTVTSKGWQFWLGAAALVATAILVSFNLRTWTKFFVVLFFLSVVGVIIAVVLMLLNGRDDFRAALSGFGMEYDAVIATARENGYAGGESFSWKNTIGAMPLAFASFGYSIVSTYAAGEVRAPRKTLLKALLTALAISVAIVFIMMAVAARSFGHDFLGSITYLANVVPDEYALSAPPFYFFFAAMLTDSTILIAVMGVSFAIAFFVALPPTFLIATRSLFAWSFDRIIPTKVSEVNERTHSPLIANAVVLVITLIFLAIIVYGPSEFLTLLFTAGAAELLTFIVVAIAGAVFPWRRRDLYEDSPVAGNLGAIPRMAIIGVLSAIVYVLFLVPLLINDDLGANATPGIVAMITIALLPFVVYGISYAVNKSRGVDLSLTFRELPPE
jgi:amino acid transporter